MLNPGLYFPQLPKLPKVELRIEGFKAEPSLGTTYVDPALIGLATPTTGI